MEPNKEINQKYIENLENHIISTKESVKYSLERFDILIISLATSALILSIGFVKDIVVNFECLNLTLLKISWLLFLVALITNLFSQVTGYFANNLEIKISKNLIKEEKGKPMKGNQVKLECKKVLIDNSTKILNGLSLLSLITGIIILVTFLSKNI